LSYLDSNLFIYAALYDDDRGEKARDHIKMLREEDEVHYTSALTFDEVFWIVKQEKGEESALEVSRAMLEMRNLKFVEVNTSLLWECYKLIERYGLDPRDSIHLACASKVNEEIMISEDEDFDGIDEIKRKWIL